jgi:ABC-type Fe3+-hydroxamate transport system substrate-binding protein
MLWRYALVPLALTALMFGCRSADDGIGGKPPTKQYANVVSLSPSTTEFLTGINGSIFLAGRTESCDRPDEILKIPVVTDGIHPNPEKIMAEKPDLIIYDKSLYGDDEIAKIKALGVETMEYDAKNIEEYIDFGYRLAGKLCIETHNENHVNTVIRDLAKAQANQTSKPKTTVLLGKPADGDYLVMGLEGMHAFLIQACGGTPVGAGGRMFQTAKIESLIDWNPAVIYSDGNAQALYDDPRLQSIDAIKNQHVYDVDAKDLVRVGGKLDLLIRTFGNDFAKMQVNPRTEAGQ